MPTLLTSEDKAKIKRHIPQASNKIITAAIARLYVALPGEPRWKDTGLSGAAVLAFDEVAKCFFFKLVDVVGTQGILWDQELYEAIQYRQDRTFFHSFEITDCIAAFSFAEEHEARNFFAKVESRQKKVPSKSGMGSMGRRVKGLFGKVDKEDISAPRPDSMVQTAHIGQAQQNGVKTSTIDPNDPEWAGMIDQLAALGISQDQIPGNEEFIKNYLSQRQAEYQEPPPRSQAPPPPPPPPPTVSQTTHKHTAPPPPPSQGPVSSTEATESTSPRAPRAPAIRNLPPPPSANIAPMRTLPPPVATTMIDTTSRDSLDSAKRSNAPAPPVSRSKKGPPPPPARSRPTNQTPEPPYAPAIPGKVPLEDESPSRKFNVPPAFEGVRKSASLSRPTPPAPSVPSRAGPAIPSRGGPPYPPPTPARSNGPPVPSRSDNPRSVPQPPPPSGDIPPPPPPPPPASVGGSIPPRKSMQHISKQISSHGIAPPLMPQPSSGPPTANLEVPSAPGREDLMASIRAGNSKGLKKTKTVDKSAPAVPGAITSTSSNRPSAGASRGSDMASQLAAMLGARNKKVAHNSDDESDEDW